jgi:hypothetical protein
VATAGAYASPNGDVRAVAKQIGGDGVGETAGGSGAPSTIAADQAGVDMGGAAVLGTGAGGSGGDASAVYEPEDNGPLTSDPAAITASGNVTGGVRGDSSGAGAGMGFGSATVAGDDADGCTTDDGGAAEALSAVTAATDGAAGDPVIAQSTAVRGDGGAGAGVGALGALGGDGGEATALAGLINDSAARGEAYAVQTGGNGGDGSNGADGGDGGAGGAGGAVGGAVSERETIGVTSTQQRTVSINATGGSGSHGAGGDGGGAVAEGRLVTSAQYNEYNALAVGGAAQGAGLGGDVEAFALVGTDYEAAYPVYATDSPQRHGGRHGRSCGAARRRRVGLRFRGCQGRSLGSCQRDKHIERRRRCRLRKRRRRRERRCMERHQHRRADRERVFRRRRGPAHRGGLRRRLSGAHVRRP